jgi:hypothetical protein
VGQKVQIDVSCPGQSNFDFWDIGLPLFRPLLFAGDPHQKTRIVASEPF